MTDDPKGKIVLEDGSEVEILMIRMQGLPEGKLLANVGIAIVLWASLEDDLHLILRKFLATEKPKVADIVTATFWQYRIVTGTMRTIAPIVLDGEDGPKTAGLREILGRIEKLGEERGYIAHAVWWAKPTGETLGIKLKRGRSETDDREITVEYLRDLCMRIREATKDLRNWYVENVLQTPSS